MDGLVVIYNGLVLERISGNPVEYHFCRGVFVGHKRGFYGWLTPEAISKPGILVNESGGEGWRME